MSHATSYYVSQARTTRPPLISEWVVPLPLDSSVRRLVRAGCSLFSLVMVMDTAEMGRRRHTVLYPPSLGVSRWITDMAVMSADPICTTFDGLSHPYYTHTVLSTASGRQVD